MNFPVFPSHIRTELSQEDEATKRPSGEKATWKICRWCPVRRVMGLLEGRDGDDEKGDHRKSVWSSEPEMRSSGVF